MIIDNRLTVMFSLARMTWLMKRGPKVPKMSATARVRAAQVQKGKMKRKKKQTLVLPHLQAAQAKPDSDDLAKQIKWFLYNILILYLLLRLCSIIMFGETELSGELKLKLQFLILLT